MEKVTLRYGSGELSAFLPDRGKWDFLEAPCSSESSGPGNMVEMVKEALASPVDSEPLHGLVKRGETVCIVFSDITRSWQRTDLYLPLVVEELEKGGVQPEDITLLCALGTHRPHSEEELRRLTGPLYGNYSIIDHDCDDRDNLVYLGRTIRGTVVELNRRAIEADRLILTGGIVFHLMAGYSGGRKSLVPGISSRKTIDQNHALSLDPEEGKGSHSLIGCDRLLGNPLHEDLMDALEMVRPDFLVNVIPGKGGVGAAVAGHYDRAHREGCRKLREFFLLPIEEKRDRVIASAGGFPGDINFYQSVKTLINASQALNPGGILILVSRCEEGLGNPLMEEMLGDFSSLAEREAFLRANYSIGRFIAYYGCELASRFRIFLVCDREEPALTRAGIRSFSSLQEAVDEAERSESEQGSYWILPDGAHTFPRWERSGN
ncbi:MAG: nickel-dependent lactate racemase [Spirochaetales bacterium]|nr:nickel-dependent lactate racemase [Spirochaetales bacterium]